MAGRDKLTAVGVRAITKPGRHSDGGGLYLRVKPSGSKSWSFMWKRQGLQREIGLGAFPDTSLKLARTKASLAREGLAAGEDPRSILRPVPIQTFKETALACMAERKLEDMNPKTKRKWERTAFEHCKVWQNRPVESLNRDDVYRVLSPIWNKTPETGRIVRSQLEIIFNYAKGRGWIQGENPAIWKGGLESVLKPVSRKGVKHHAAMPYDQIPDFFKELQKGEAIAARALEFTILTATRTSEALKSTIDEFNLENAIWTLPETRMKSGRSHAVPLSPRAVEIITEMRSSSISQYIFPGNKAKRPLSNMSMSMLLRRMEYEDITVHGFRSTFRDWAGDRTHFSREVAEAALSHAIGDTVERSYRRQSALEKRKSLMEAWDQFCTGSSSSNVVPIYASST
ncbi:MAG: integrase arm-type DNA-binding domain-containing protein [Maricaulaceae bacterium]